jgi:hypothetical protein
MAAPEGGHDDGVGGHVGVIKFLDGLVKHGHDEDH